ncbi:hypothetical protein OG21DRAFT_1269071 [Imleria badia]|nr:hypothetical protein OG21DRAFT_1269071 [Imleria badia]
MTFLVLIKAIIVFMAGDYDDAMFRVDDITDTVGFNSICHVVQAYMYLLRGNSLMESRDYHGAIPFFERARIQTRHHKSEVLSVVSLCLCEALYVADRIKEAGKSMLKLVNTVDEDIYKTGLITWVSEFLQRCLSAPESSAGTTLHSLSPSPLLREWAKLQLTGSSWKDALVAARDFTAPRFTTYRALCDHLEMLDQITVAIECFDQMNSELADKMELHAEQADWIIDFKQRLSIKLEYLEDTAVNAQQLSEAISEYSSALSLNRAAPCGLLIKRSKAYVALSLWEDASNDANEVIALDPSPPWGYERKHAALHRAGRYEYAVSTFETMLLKISQSPHPEICERRREYVNAEQTKATIRASIENAIRESPLALINTNSGRLLDKSEQACSFESQPVFRELISATTTHIDHARIDREVAEYYRYATFSHKWEANEPLFEKVLRIVVYDLEESLTHNKLQMFCKIVRDSGFHWAWSETCCINKADHFVLQEALLSMFKWYEGSDVTIVLLRGVRSPSKRGDLVKSTWNTRAWTLQEYHASKAVRFYTEDWKPYLDLDIPNHKESPEIILEMEEATGVSARALMALRPGLEDIREKLRLASTRQTTRVEDAAYSLLGIFSMSLGVVYGEGDKALGRFLAQLLTSSGDPSILSWTGRSGSFNSCLPANITVFNQRLTTHMPLAVKSAEIDVIIARLRSSSLNSTSIMSLYDRLQELPVPLFVGQRMRLPCIIFKLGRLSATRGRSGHVFRAQASSLGVVEIRTEEDLSGFGALYLVHPWIDFLLDRQSVKSTVETVPEEIIDDQSSLIDDLPSFAGHSNITSAAVEPRPAGFVTPVELPFSGRPSAFSRDTASLQPPSEKPIPRIPSFAESLRPPSSLSPIEIQTLALQVIARLRQPFGALVATESLITVQLEEITPTILDSLC